MCRICQNNHDNSIVVVREMMFGTGHEFEYLVCAACGCIQRIESPDNLSDYYPPDYYSFETDNALKRFLKTQQASYASGRWNPIGKLLSRWFAPHKIAWLAATGVSTDAPILDVGCGTGQLLLDMSKLGFTDLTGVDSYIDGDITYSDQLRIYKRRIEQLSGEFEVIMFHHSFEHMEHPRETLEVVHRLLSPTGTVLIRIPVADSYAWRHYGVNWVQIDAPRHSFIHTRNSMTVLAGQTQFMINSIVYDSTSLQFVGSERYAAGIPLRGADAHRKIHTRKQVREFRSLAEQLNRAQQGDQACFYLKKRQ